MTYAIILAAGLSGRFGSNKLLYPAEGIPMFSRIFRTVFSGNRFDGVVVVTAYDEIEEMAGELAESGEVIAAKGIQKTAVPAAEGKASPSLIVVRNDRQDLGISYSVRLGAAAVPEGVHLMFFVSDQPWVGGTLIAKILDEAASFPEAIVAPASENGTGNPVCFAPKFREELMALTGDRGGKQVLKRHPEALRTVEAGEEELADYDEMPECGEIRREGEKEHHSAVGVST